MQTQEKPKRQKKPNPVSTEVRLKVGRLSVDEVCNLKNIGKTKFYEDVKAGRVILDKDGRRSSIRGPIAALYIAGLPMPSNVEAA